MRTTRGEYGPALMVYVDAELALLDVSPTSFALKHGIQPGQFTRWRQGIMPGLDAITELAAALGKPPLELLAITIGAVQDGDPGAPAHFDPPTIAAAIALAPDLTEQERELLQGVLAGLQKFRQGADEVSSKRRKR